MLFNTVLVFAAVALAGTPGSPCNDGHSPPCDKDMVCVASPCVPGTAKCPSYCEFKNHYKPCGGDPPKTCDRNSKCIDDPRDPANCGRGCDMYGICIPKKTQACGRPGDAKCPTGKYCYSGKCL